MCPIQGLTINPTRPPDPTVGLPLIGILYKGEKRTQEDIDRNKPGGELEYFRVEFPDKRFPFKEAFEECYGAKPEAFECLLFGHTPDEVFPNWRTLRVLKGKRIGRMCDGEHQVYWVDEAHRPHGGQDKPEEWIDCNGGGEHGGCKECGFNGKLKIFLPKLAKLTGALGYFLLNTGSQRDIENVHAALTKAANFEGDLEMIVWMLGRSRQHMKWMPYEKAGEKKVTELFRSFLYLEPIGKVARQIAGELEARKTDEAALGGGAPEETPLLTSSAQGESSGYFDTLELKEQEEDAEFEETQPDSQSQSPDEYCSEVYIQASKGAITYVLKCQAHNYFLNDPKLLTALGFETDQAPWTKAGTKIPMNPILMVWVDGTRVTDLRIDDIPF